MTNGNSFLDFIVAAKKNRELAVAFMQLMSPEDIKPFLDGHGYIIAEEDVEKVVEVRQLFAEMQHPQGGDRY
jgi:hypothetical protein